MESLDGVQNSRRRAAVLAQEWVGVPHATVAILRSDTNMGLPAAQRKGDGEKGDGRKLL